MNPPAIAVTVPVKKNVGANDIDAVQAIVQTDRHNPDVSFATIAIDSLALPHATNNKEPKAANEDAGEVPLCRDITTSNGHDREELAPSPSEELRAEQLAHRITRSGAEQARRLAECARESLTTLIRHLDQPCLSIDRNGHITHWNDSMASLIGIPANDAIGAPLTNLLPLAPPHPLDQPLASLTSNTTYQSESWIAQILPGPITLIRDIEVSQIKLIPLYHVPGTLAAIIVLITV